MRGTRRLPLWLGGRGRIIPAHAGNSRATPAAGPGRPDHPRACGELSTSASRPVSPLGSSPRMRGTRGFWHRLQALRRIIPAHAGNSPMAVDLVSEVADHPRACGELRLAPTVNFMGYGSSPRMRGTLSPERPERCVPRIIPAHAGNSGAQTCPAYGSPDHPRACGELPTGVVVTLQYYGSSPRMRGTLDTPTNLGPIGRIIPAHAGNSAHDLKTRLARADHPRACGELLGFLCSQPDALGSSPRMRGTRLIRHWRRGWLRIIPAHAGNSWRQSPWPRLLADHPRACGELILADVTAARLIGSSPRMRGTRFLDSLRNLRDRIIPAHAGNSTSLIGPVPLPPDHPRACGELLDSATGCETLDGSSPRMRGTPGHSITWVYCMRIIPAHAGNSHNLAESLSLQTDHPRACGELGSCPCGWAFAAGSSPRMRGTQPAHSFGTI